MFRSLLAAAGALSLAGAAASAQDNRNDRARDEARTVMRAFGACLVDHASMTGPHGRLVVFLNTPPTGRDGARTGTAVSDPECLTRASSYVSGVRMRFRADLLRGAVFRALYLQRGRTPIARAEIEPGFAQPETAVITALQHFGDCVVAGDATNADLAIRGAAGTAAESGAYQALAPVMGACLPRGRQWRFTREVLEGVLAEGLYRRTTAPAPAPHP
ncbi:hypothetical protein [Sphingomonas sp.]|uniref:hypothetical protein n=1 Tax=Sphingomonas sp. TaxID=28214 RepID=UPI003CC6A556